MSGLQAIRQSPEDAAEIARMLGIQKELEVIRRSREEKPQSYVYLIDTYTEGSRYYKIGRSVVPHARLETLRTGHGANMPPDWEGQPLRPLALRLGSASVETAIHADLCAYRLPKTEWFVANLAVSQYVVDQDAWNEWAGEKPNPDDFAAPVLPQLELLSSEKVTSCGA